LTVVKIKRDIIFYCWSDLCGYHLWSYNLMVRQKCALQLLLLVLA